MIQVDTIYKVYVGDTSAFLEPGNDGDYPASYLTLKTTEKASQDWFGQINITLTQNIFCCLAAWSITLILNCVLISSITQKQQ